MVGTIVNRSVPSASVIPVLAYEDVAEACDWLAKAFGFKVRLRIGDHRAQLVFGDGAVIVTARDKAALDAGAIFSGGASRAAMVRHSVHVRVDDAKRHYEHAMESGARVLQPPTDYPYGERQYTALDLGGHLWTFSESIADVDPASWGATSIDIS
ncbi:MAG: VOC family protein [Candidatus Limnocylindria bacterium]